MNTVGELKSWLEELDDNMPVLLARDGEGNSFGSLTGFETQGFRSDKNGEYTGIPEDVEYLVSQINDELREQGFDEEDSIPDAEGTACVVLWP